MTLPHVHIIGAGLAGLAAAVRLTAAGHPVTVYDGAGHAGGRCRSFDAPTMGRRIDNGNHLMLSGNGHTMAYLQAIGAADTLWQPPHAAFPFMNIATGERWQISPGRGRVPLWLFDKTRRAPCSTALQNLAALKLLWARPSATVADCFDTDSPFYKLFLEPLAIAVLNTSPREAAARLLVPVLKQTLGRGEAACRPCIPKRGLSESLIDPALKFIRAGGGEILLHRRIRNLGFDGNRLLGFARDDELISLAADDRVIVATPPEAAVSLVPGLQVPHQSSAIVNAHFKLDEAVPEPGFFGLVNGTSQWIFVREAIASVTISAADDLVDQGTEEIAALVWPEICRVLDLPDQAMPPYRVIKEKRATIAQTPAQEALRPPTATAYENLLLAGDWTATGLPATIEGAILSGDKAAAAILG